MLTVYFFLSVSDVLSPSVKHTVAKITAMVMISDIVLGFWENRNPRLRIRKSPESLTLLNLNCPPL
jgi:hypothetical protein